MTVQAPHCPRSQPFLVPVRCRRSRSRSSSVTRGSSSAIVRFTPFTVRLVVMLMQCSEDSDGVERPRAAGSRPCGLLAIGFAWTLGVRRVGALHRDDGGMASPLPDAGIMCQRVLHLIYGGCLRFSSPHSRCA